MPDLDYVLSEQTRKIPVVNEPPWRIALFIALTVVLSVPLTFAGFALFKYPILDLVIYAALGALVLQRRVLAWFLLVISLVALSSAIGLPQHVASLIAAVAVFWALGVSHKMPDKALERALARAEEIGPDRPIASMAPGTLVKAKGHVRAVASTSGLDGDPVVWSAVRFSNRRTDITRRTRFVLERRVDFVLITEDGQRLLVQATGGTLSDTGGKARPIPAELAARFYDTVPAEQKKLEAKWMDKVVAREQVLRDGDRVVVLGTRVKITGPGEGLPRVAASVPAIGRLGRGGSLVILPGRTADHGVWWHTVRPLVALTRRLKGRSTAAAPATAG
jgi:hypothetical protein